MNSLPDLGDIRFLKVRDAGSVLNATVAFLRRNAREVFLSYLAIVGPLYVAATVLQTIYLGRIESTIAGAYGVGLPDLDELAVPALLLFAVGLATGIVGQAAAGAYVRLYREGEAGTITPTVLWDETRTLLGPIAGFNVVVGLAFMGMALVNIVPCLGQIAFLVGALWAVPRVAVMGAVIVAEDRGLGDAWERARVLVKGEWGFAFGALLMALVIYVVITVALGVPAAIVDAVVGVNSLTGTSSSLWATVLLAPIQVFAAAAYLLPLVAAFFVHGRLAEEMDGSALHDDLDVLAGSAFERAAMPDASTPPAPRADRARDDRAAPRDAPDTDRDTDRDAPRADRGGESGPPDGRPSDDAPSGFRGGGFGS